MQKLNESFEQSTECPIRKEVDGNAYRLTLTLQVFQGYQLDTACGVHLTRVANTRH